jgi:hypothetical protein
MPRGVLNRYRTRMMTADDTFEEPSPKWSRFYAKHGWATPVPAEPLAPPRPAMPKPPAEMTRQELLEVAEEKGVELPSGYVPKAELVELVENVDEDSD